MALEVNDLLSILDIEAGEDATPETLTEAIKAKWVPRALAHEDTQIAGRVLGGTETGVKRILKSVADTLGLEDADIQAFKISNLGKDDAENNPLLKSTERIKARMAELEKAKPAKGADSKEWETKLETAKQEAATFKQMLKEKADEYDNFRETVTKTEKENKRKALYSDSFNAVFKDNQRKLASDVDEFKIRGFNAHIHDNYRYDIEDDNRHKVYDKDGNTVKNAKGVDVATLTEVIAMEMEKANMFAKNNGAATPAKPTFRAAAAGSDKDKTPAMRKAEEHAERLRRAAQENNA